MKLIDETISDCNVIPGPACVPFEVEGPLFAPYFNRWGEDVYHQYRAFDHDPFTIAASSTSGSPVLLDATGRFFGFLTDRIEVGCRFRFDGDRTLAIDVPAGQSLWVDRGAAAWDRYTARVIESERLAYVAEEATLRRWALPEYCTWVEQKRGMAQGRSAQDVLDDRFVMDYLDRVDALGLPPGKFSLDHGWTPGHESYGDWTFDRNRFRDPARLVRAIESAGFVPGIWMAPVWLHPQSRVARRRPELIGPHVAGASPDSPLPGDWNYWADDDAIEPLLRDAVEPLIDLGFRKIKCDMLYADKRQMKALMRRFYRAVKSIDVGVEVEVHHPDVFFTSCGDTVRTNDVLCNPQRDWRGLTLAHFDVCHRSAPHRIINLDHVGGNDPGVSPDDFLEHVAMFRAARGHPVVSLLPDRSEGDAPVADALRDYLRAYLDGDLAPLGVVDASSSRAS